MPHAFNVDLPPSPLKPLAPAAPAVAAAPLAFVVPAPSPAVAAETPETEATRPEPVARVSAGAPMEIHDIALTSNPLTAPNQDEAWPKPPQAELKPLGVKKTVAVVDDDPMMLDVLARILQRENFQLLMASGGPEIIQKLGEHDGDVDLLVTDYAMPDMQGRELADHVRQRFPAIKVLYQTGFSDMLFENRTELQEGAAFLEKPFTARGLREAARLVLFARSTPRASEWPTPALTLALKPRCPESPLVALSAAL